MTLNQAIKILEAAGVDSPVHDARELFRLYCPEPVMTNTECDNPKLLEMINRRANREPLQYIIGRVGFYRESYIVSPACLIPRSDTEILVDYAVKNLPEGESFMDLCTGSGCIAISVLCNTKSTTAIAVDIDAETLKIAEKNASLNGVEDRIEFRQLDLMQSVPEESIFAVLSNPPYVTDEAYEKLESEIFSEPRRAFVGGVDGGDFYRHLTPIYKTKIAKDGFIAYEIGYDQANLLKQIAADNNMSCEILRDLGGNDRVAVLKNLA